MYNMVIFFINISMFVYMLISYSFVRCYTNEHICTKISNYKKIKIYYKINIDTFVDNKNIYV